MTARTWFITGTSSGFGRLLTEQLLARGDRVAATLRTPASLTDLTEVHGPDKLWVRALDVTDAARIRKVVDEAFAELGHIDVVVSNAGYGLLGAAEELTDEQIARQIDTNLVGSIQLARAAIPHLREQGGGRIIQVSSMGGQIAFPGLSLYHATKWGIEGFYESVISEVAPFGIEVTLVEPGGAPTSFGGSSMAAAEPTSAYVDGPVGQMRFLAGNLESAPADFNDPSKIAREIIDSTEMTPAPKRLTLGADAYQLITAALKDRLCALESARDLAHAVTTKAAID